MWKLVAAVIVALNGAPVGEPETLTWSNPFPTEQACKDFRATPVHDNAIEELTAEKKRANPGKDVSVTTDCQPVD